jgi:hypothetical protein
LKDTKGHKIEQLREFCRLYGLDFKGKRRELELRLIEHCNPSLQTSVIVEEEETDVSTN